MHNQYHFKPYQLLEKKQPADLGLEFTSLQRIECSSEIEITSGPEELCLAIIGGALDYNCSGMAGPAEMRDMLYVPRQSAITLSGKDVVVMQYSAPSDRDAEFKHFSFADIDANPKTHKVFGNAESSCKRDVWQFIDSDFSCSRLMMGMCRGSIGGWTSWPPHEHARQREEVYVYFDMGNAFAVQCVYDDMDDPYTVAMVRNGDCISIPRGFHPNVGCPGGAISFVYCMVAKTPGERDFMDLHVQEIYGDKKDME